MTDLQIMEPSGELKAIDAGSLLAAAGILAVDEAATVDLAEFDANVAHLKRIADEARATVGDELVRRLDRRGSWTVREHGYEIKSSSPEAGTTGFDSGLLHDALARLVDDGVIEREAASRALEVVEPSVLVPCSLLRDLRDALDGEHDMDHEDRLRLTLGELLRDEPEPRLVQHRAGINALLKVPAARVAVQACEISLTPPRRKATVKPIAARP